MSRHKTTPVAPLVCRLLYSTFRGNKYTVYGISAERTTITEYIHYKAKEGVKVKVAPSGLLVHEEHHFLAASPDGVVSVVPSGESGLIEVKNLLQNKQQLFCLQCADGRLQVRKKHKFYYQCQGLLNISRMPWIDFVVRVERPYQLFVERILRDTTEWERMLVALSSFYFRPLLPELVAPRQGKHPGIRDPVISDVSTK